MLFRSRSDVYSLGVIFFEMLTSQKPFTDRNAMGIIFKHSEAPIPTLPRRLSKYQQIIDSLLAKKPEDRIQTAAGVLRWL